MVLFIQCVILCIIFTFLILPPQFKDPLSQITSYPPAIRERVESLPQYKDCLKRTKEKNIARKIVGTIIATIALALLAYLSGNKTFASAFIHVFILFFVVNMYDLIVLDLLIFSNSKKLVIPGTEDMAGEYKNPIHHIRGAIKGSIIGAVVAMLSASLVVLINYIALVF